MSSQSQLIKKKKSFVTENHNLILPREVQLPCTICKKFENSAKLKNLLTSISKYSQNKILTSDISQSHPTS